MPARLLIACWRYVISPVLPPSCRFEPSCSQYADSVLRSHGLLHGGFLAIVRILRCNPWGGSGPDPPPPPRRR